MAPRMCSRCWQVKPRGLQFTIRAQDNPEIMAQYDVCDLCVFSLYGHWRTFVEVVPLGGKPPWEYRLSVTPWYPDE